jgi:3-hydroxyisobutyrate dehydrogenase-like beta-hydroxyacid dehydrogenase
MTSGSDETTKPVGLVGLGTMGRRFAARLLDHGFGVVGYDTSRPTVEELTRAGGRGATSAAEVANLAETVLVSLPSPESVHAVTCGPDGLHEGSVIRTYIDLSTTGPATAEQVAAHLSARGIRCVDAPVSGGPAGAEAGTLTVMVSGADDSIRLVRPVLDVIGSKLFVVGDRPGQAQLVKVINNLLSATAIAITGEALALAAKAGLDPAHVLDVVNVSSGASNASADKFPKQVLTRSFNHGFGLDLMAKDVRLCLDEADRHGVPMILGGTVDQLWRLADQVVENGADCTAIVQMFEAWAGTRITAPREGLG